MRTGNSDIYAVGDLASFNYNGKQTRIEHYSTAMD